MASEAADRSNLANRARIDYFDIAKGLAMFCVIAGHMGVWQVNAFAFSFHMPLYLLISGYFFRNDATKVWRNSKRLLCAYGWTVLAVIVLSELLALAKVLIFGEDAFSLIKTAGKWIVAGLYGSGSRRDFLCFELPKIGAIWFLLALAIGGGILLIVNKLQKTWQQCAAILIIFIVGWLSAHWTWLPFSIQSGMCATLFMYVGYRAHAFKDLEKERILLALCTLIWLVALYFSFINGKMGVVSSSYPNPVINIAGSVAGTYVILCISRYLERVASGACMNYLLFWGKNTLIVLCAHLVELNCLPWSKVYALIDSRLIGLIIVFCLKVLWATLAVLLVNQLKKTRISLCRNNPA